MYNTCLCISILFLIATGASFLCSENCYLVFGLLVWYTLDFIQLHKKVQWSQSTFVDNLLSNNLHCLCLNVEVFSHVVSTFVTLFEDERFLNETVIHCSKNVCKKQQLLDVPQNADHKDDCLQFHTICLLKIYV
jgi:hypothetical protein